MCAHLHILLKNEDVIEMYVEIPIKLGDKILHFEGHEKDVLFHQIKKWCLNANAPKELQDTIIEILKNVGGIKEDRLLVLVGSLLVENAIDNYLSAILPDFESLRIRSFFVKINLANSLRLSPSNFFSCAHRIREVRNDFVHDLSIDSFDKLLPKRIDSLSSNLRSFDPSANLISASDIFRNVIIFLTMGLQLYATHVRLLNDFIRSDEFIPHFQAYCEKKGYGQL